MSAGEASDRGRLGDAFGWRGALLGTLIVPTGVGIAIGALAAQLIEPGWTAGGAPYVTGYPKNVEMHATLIGVAVGGLSAALVRWRLAWLAAIGVAGAGFGYAAYACDRFPGLLVLAALTLATPLAIGLKRLRAPHAAPWLRHAWWWVGAVGLLSAIFFGLCTRPLTIDTFHYGEILASALDLLAGGRPFVTFIWPHGLHDTGLAALWIAVTGKVGTSPVALALGTSSALAVPTFYLLIRRALGSAATAAMACWLLLPLLAAAVGSGFLSQISTLVAFGSLVGSAAALYLGTSRSAPAAALAGVALVLGHLLRIEAGLFAAAAVVVAVICHRWTALHRVPRAARVAAVLRAIALMAGGAAAAVVATRLAVGWPDSQWFDFVFRQLPHYHRDATGLAFPWPCGTAGGWSPDRLVTVGTLVLPTMLIAAAARRLLGGRPPIATATPEQIALLAFLATFGWLALRYALGRSDTPHFLWFHPLLLCAIALAATPSLIWVAARPRIGVGAAAVLAAVIIAGNTARIASALDVLAEHLRPNPPVGPCADTMFTAREAAQAANASFIAATCELEPLLHRHGVSRLVIDHAAPWYYARFRMPPPSRYYSLNRAYAPPAQRRFIDDIRAAGVQALFVVQGYGAMSRYDVANALRVPVIEAYLRARRRGAPAVETPLGRLYFWNEAEAAGPPADIGAESAAESIVLHAGRIFAVPSSGFLVAQGPIAEGGESWRTVGAVGGDADADVSVAGLRAPVGTAAYEWSLVARTTPGELASIRLALQTGDGRRLATFVPTAERQLPRLIGSEWDDLHEEVTAAAALGAADRARAVAEAAP